MDHATGVWYDGLEAALYLWDAPLCGPALRQVRGAYGRVLDALELVAVHQDRFIPYVAILALSLKTGGFGRLVPDHVMDSFPPWVLNLWREMGATAPFRSAAAATIQGHWRKWRRAFAARLEPIRRQLAARRIQRACHDWILRPVTADGRQGINVRLLTQLHAGGGPLEKSPLGTS